MEKIRDPALLKKVWMSWRTEVGEKIRPLFLNLIKLSNKAAEENGKIFNQFYPTFIVAEGLKFHTNIV